jgi:hypothetical protein
MSNPESSDQARNGQAGLWNIFMSQHTSPDGQDPHSLSRVSVSQAAQYWNQHASTCVPPAFEETPVEHRHSSCDPNVTLQRVIPPAVFQTPQSDNQSSVSDFWSPGRELSSSGISSPSTILSETIPGQLAAKPEVNLKFVEYSLSRTQKTLAPKHGRRGKPSEKTGCNALISRPDALKKDTVRSHRFSTFIHLF